MPDNNLWQEEVTKKRAQIYAERNPRPPMSFAKKVYITLLSMVGLGLCYLAFVELIK